RRATASRPTTIATVFLDFFLRAAASSGVSGAAFFFSFLAFLSLSFLSAFPASAVAPAGASTLKRYLHFGHSTLVPTAVSSLTVTWCSQLGHGTLKLAMESPTGGGRGGCDGDRKRSRCHLTERAFGGAIGFRRGPGKIAKV